MKLTIHKDGSTEMNKNVKNFKDNYQNSFLNIEGRLVMIYRTGAF